MTREQEQSDLADQRAQPQPADGGIGAMTDMQGREPDTRNELRALSPPATPRTPTVSVRPS